jgi:hypothetical protein
MELTERMLRPLKVLLQKNSNFFLKITFLKMPRLLQMKGGGYLPLKKTYPNLKQIPSNEGNNFIDLHIHIMNLKGWLRGIHHHCSSNQTQGYLDECHFRYNRRNNLGIIFDFLLVRLIESPPIRLK